MSTTTWDVLTAMSRSNEGASSSREIGSALRRWGGHLASVVMPNIGAFIAWGLATALFMPEGWLPNATLAVIIQPMITTLLPILIGYTGGRVVHGQRGGVVGAVATLGLVVGANTPMLLGAMLLGPATALLMKWFDQAVGARVGPAFKMLVDNFSAGIIGGSVAILGMVGIGPAISGLARTLAGGVQALIDLGLLPLAALIIEPGKVLFLNNAINHGVLGPLGVTAQAENGKAIEFLLETNPGPGLGILLACACFGSAPERASAPGALAIHFLGGIHEIYFPYVLAKPQLILAAIAGGAAGIFTFIATGAGLFATPSPGSIIALMAVTPRGGHLSVITGVAVSAAVSFVLAAFLVKVGRKKTAESPRTDYVTPASATLRTPAAECRGKDLHRDSTRRRG
ncbi:PTS mannitol transporter subunit IICB [Saccharopolyspora sp. NPDC050642]|uniref:PTS mannitol transporter subunit IICB n=1 Tax=Saccharopolyspora sp. NPDC050642 TaxID=3157099 RepID=UPI0033D2063F